MTYSPAQIASYKSSLISLCRSKFTSGITLTPKDTLSPLLCVCLCVCVQVHVQYTQRPGDSLRCYSSVFHWCLQSLLVASTARPASPASTRLHTPSTRTAIAHCHSQTVFSNVCSQGSNSGLHACAADTLLAEPALGTLFQDSFFQHQETGQTLIFLTFVRNPGSQDLPLPPRCSTTRL